MTRLMDLVAGQSSDIIEAIATGDLAALDDRRRFPAHLALGSGLDPTWLDLFAEAARTVLGGGPGDFLDARIDLDPNDDVDGHAIERVDPAWIEAVALIPDARFGAIASAWIDLVEDELGELPPDEKPWILDLTARLVRFCRAADRAPDILFAWSIR